MNPSELFIRRPIATILVMLAIAVSGILGFWALPISELPNVDFPTIEVNASLPGASPELMAAAVATPLERQFMTIQGLASINSSSTQGSTQITLQFNLDRNIDAAAGDVQVAISAASHLMPPGMPSPPTFHKQDPSAAPILFLALHSNAFLLSKVDGYAETQLAERLSMIEGVAQVNVYGAQKYAVRVELDPRKLQARGLGPGDVAQAIAKGNVNVPGGTLQGPSQFLAVQPDGQLPDAAAFSRLAVAYRNGAAVHIGDLGTVENSVENDQNLSWYGTKKGISRAIVLAISRQPGSNTISVADQILKALPALRAEVPPAIRMSVMYNRAVSIRQSVQDVERTLLLTMGLVVLVIFLFLRSVSATLIPALALPTSIMVTFGAMYVLGFSLDSLSLMALTLCTGFVVDDAIVVLENIVRHTQMGKSRWQAALEGSREIGFTVLAMTISLVAVFIPVLFMAGILGRLFNEFGITISVAILASGLISLTLTPMLASRLLREHGNGHHGRVYNILERGFEAWRSAYVRSLERVLVHKRLALVAMAAILLITGWLFNLVPKGFLPTEDSGLVVVSTEANQGVSLDTIAAKQKQLMAIIGKDPNVSRFMSAVGAGGPNGAANEGHMFLILKPASQRHLNIEQVVGELRRKASRIVGLRVFMMVPPAIRIGGIISKSQYQLVVQGLDTASLYSATPKLVQALTAIPGIVGVNSDMEQANPQVNVTIDRARAAAYGVTASDIENTLDDAYGQPQISTLYGSTDQYKVILQVAPRFQTDPSAMGMLDVRSASGRLVPLEAVANLSSGVGPVSVNHVGPFVATTISFDVKGGASLGAVTSEVQKIADQTLPAGVTAHFAGTAQVFKDSMTSLGLLLGLAILVIYIVLGILYESFIHPLTVLSGLPSAGMGALLTLLVFGKQLDLYGFVGLIMLIGLVKKNAIILIDFAIETQRREGKTAAQAILAACNIRFRPIMMTTMAALAGTLPIALGLGAGGDARQPLGLAVEGGLVVSQVLTLYITPVVYIYLDKLQQRLTPAPIPVEIVPEALVTRA